MAKTNTKTPNTNELITNLTNALKGAEQTLKDASELLNRLGRPIAGASCEKYRQTCLEAIELVDGPPAVPAAPSAKLEPEVPIPEV